MESLTGGERSGTSAKKRCATDSSAPCGHLIGGGRRGCDVCVCVMHSGGLTKQKLYCQQCMCSNCTHGHRSHPGSVVLTYSEKVLVTVQLTSAGNCRAHALKRSPTGLQHSTTLRFCLTCAWAAQTQSCACEERDTCEIHRAAVSHAQHTHDYMGVMVMGMQKNLHPSSAQHMYIPWQ